MKDKLRAAFEVASRGYSPDRVVADPELRAVFVAECRSSGLAGSEATLNRALLNLRKRGELRGIRSKRSSFANQDQYRFASEIAARFLERRDGISLDAIICDPVLAVEFDEIAGRLAPGFSPVEYRWAALNLRKKHGLKPELLSRVVHAESVEQFELEGLDLARISAKNGLYIIFTVGQVLYVGEAENLQNRLRKHLDHSDNKGLARWLWENSSAKLHVEIHVLRDDVETRVRRALESEMIASRNPLFNVKR
jgi:site-specific DNA-methyltransferase (adenine-specific)